MDQGLVAAARAAGVDLRRDTVLVLRPHAPLQEALLAQEARHVVRTLGVLKLQKTPEGTIQFIIDDPVREALEAGSRSSRKDCNKVIARLATVAKEQDIANPSIMKPITHPKARGLHELVAKGDHARVFLFYERGIQSLVICSGTHWKKGRSDGKEHKSQDEAILRAAALPGLWQQARPLQGYPDARILKGA